MMEEINIGKERKSILKSGSKKLNIENWKVYHPTGKHMFTCGEKKANWYLERNLAKQISKNKIALTFSPKGSGFEDNEEFGRSERETRCVVCGIEDNLQRHHIVPYCYRSYFPEEFKSKNHHDVVLINYERHGEYEQLANIYKDDIARIYNVKTTIELNTEYTHALREFSKKDAITLNILHSLFKTYGKISKNVLMEKLQNISANTDISMEILCNYNYIQLYKLYLFLRVEHEKEIYNFKSTNRILYDHGYHVVKKLYSDEKIKEFVKLWRNHFVDNMHPKYMQHGWSVNFRIKTKI
jgi:hypothetical protein